MRHRSVGFVLIILSALVPGCGSPSTPSSRPAASNAPADPIARVVHEFLDAVRRGDTETASVRLTPLALQRTSELELNFSPPGSDTARFEVGSVDRIDTDKAVVESIWIDLDADGQEQREKITWALKLANGTWRISGMAAELGENLPPVVMDFENPGQLAPTNSSGATPLPRTSSPARQATVPTEDPFRTGTR